MANSPGIRQTVVEPLDDLAEAGVPARAPARPAGPEAPGPDAPSDDGTFLSRPSLRPPVPVLWIFDDGRKTGELIRLRRLPLVIGQTQGDIRIPHDPAISDPHVEIAWRNRVLVVRDLQSQSGTFFRVGRLPLSAGQEMRIGSRCYHFREPGVLAMQTAAGVTRLTLVGNEVWMGRDPGPRGFRVSGDPAVDRRHARFVRDAAGQWAIHDNHSLNGVWLRREEGQVDAVAEFFAGEQRFRLELPHPGP